MGSLCDAFQHITQHVKHTSSAADEKPDANSK